MEGEPQSMEDLIQRVIFEMPTPPFTWEEYCAKRDEVRLSRALMYIRIQREKELIATDWVETSRNQETLANLDEWLAYRQALRDVPNNLTLSDITWNHGRLTCPLYDSLKRPSVVRK
jgi:hypothetical protein